MFGKKTTQVDQVVLTVLVVTRDLALVVKMLKLCVSSFTLSLYQHHNSDNSSFDLQIPTVTAPQDVDQILVIRAKK